MSENNDSSEPLFKCGVCGRPPEQMYECRPHFTARIRELEEALVHVRADLMEIRDTEPERRYSPSITILANTGIGVCDRALGR